MIDRYRRFSYITDIAGIKTSLCDMLGLGYTDGPIEYDHSLKGQAQIIKLFIKVG